MGYTTDFYGEVEVTPPLNTDEVAYLNKFSESRRMQRDKGPYYVDGTEQFGQGHDSDIWDYNRPPPEQPGLWCQWVATEDGKAIRWDGGEKFYASAEWMAYIIDHFLRPGAVASRQPQEQFARFQWNHVVDGEIEAQGEEPGDHWKLVVEQNVVTVVTARVVWDQ